MLLNIEFLLPKNELLTVNMQYRSQLPSFMCPWLLQFGEVTHLKMQIYTNSMAKNLGVLQNWKYLVKYPLPRECLIISSDINSIDLKILLNFKYMHVFLTSFVRYYFVSDPQTAHDSHLENSRHWWETDGIVNEYYSGLT